MLWYTNVFIVSEMKMPCQAVTPKPSRFKVVFVNKIIVLALVIKAHIKHALGTANYGLGVKRGLNSTDWV